VGGYSAEGYFPDIPGRNFALLMLMPMLLLSLSLSLASYNVLAFAWLVRVLT